MSSEPQDYVWLATAANGRLARRWKQALDAQGIPSDVSWDVLEGEEEDLPDVEAQILVRQEDLGFAESILRMMDSEAPGETAAGA